jgi:hypothetical protein
MYVHQPEYPPNMTSGLFLRGFTVTVVVTVTGITLMPVQSQRMI